MIIVTKEEFYENLRKRWAERKLGIQNGYMGGCQYHDDHWNNMCIIGAGMPDEFHELVNEKNLNDTSIVHIHEMGLIFFVGMGDKNLGVLQDKYDMIDTRRGNWKAYIQPFLEEVGIDTSDFQFSY